MNNAISNSIRLAAKRLGRRVREDSFQGVMLRHADQKWQS